MMVFDDSEGNHGGTYGPAQRLNRFFFGEYPPDANPWPSSFFR